MNDPKAPSDWLKVVGILRRQKDIDRQWNTVHFGPVRIETHDGEHLFQVEVSPRDLELKGFRVQLYSTSVPGGGASLIAMTACTTCACPPGAQMYSAQVSATRPASDYTARIVPHHLNASTPLEAGQIVWQR